jgi:hypothetical protein
MAIEIHVWKLVGITPLISHNPAITLGFSSDGLSVGKKKYDDENEAKIRLYEWDDGTYYHPSRAIRLLLLETGSGRKINKRAAKGVISSSIFPAEERMTILDVKGKPMKKWSIRKVPVVVNKARVMRCRPQWDNWTILVPLEIDTDFVNTDIITELLNVGGRVCGIGDERPSTSNRKNGVGSFGRFTAELVR